MVSGLHGDESGELGDQHQTDDGDTRTGHELLHATYAGRFYLPAAKCEAMYDARKSAATTGRWVEVSDK